MKNSKVARWDKKAFEWISKSHHIDGCSRRLSPYYRNKEVRHFCDCGRSELIMSYIPTPRKRREK